MAISVQEKFESRQSSLGDGASVELAFVVAGTDDDLAAKQSLRAATPVWYDGLVRQSLNIEPVGPLLWDGKVRYGRMEQQPETGESTFTFDTGGGTQHITQSIQTVGRYPNSAPDFGGAIGVTHESVEGVDITIPVYQFSETHYLPAAVVTAPYRGQLFYLTGKINSASFRGCAAGECLFLGASGSQRTKGQSVYDGDWEISFKFAASPNATGLRVGTISGISKRGWDYMWVRYQDAEDEDSKELIKKPVAVYIESVYESANFAGLGIGS
ncbi:MAG: hypothetical protein FWD61_01115 [Phycisphaerales bacterium]|nr:hypothetical protein [Phycisphaerales bacterium]